MCVQVIVTAQWCYDTYLSTNQPTDRPTDRLPVGGLLTAASAGGLFLLTVTVTPANIYMFTHGAVMSGQDAGAALGLSFHCRASASRSSC